MKRLDSKGFTLIETIYGIAILGILSIALSNLIMLTIKTYKDSKEQFNATLLAQYYFEEKKASYIVETEKTVIKSGDLLVSIDVLEVERYKERLFKITVEVIKDEMTLEKFEGYKSIDLQEIQHEEDSG
ncbi:MAG: type II secretion system GspH family protein [Firmicutes bacterium]|nr:type II secretion system GspH family protein [Bacillota bacterium]